MSPDRIGTTNPDWIGAGVTRRFFAESILSLAEGLKNDGLGNVRHSKCQAMALVNSSISPLSEPVALKQTIR